METMRKLVRKITKKLRHKTRLVLRDGTPVTKSDQHTLVSKFFDVSIPAQVPAVRTSNKSCRADRSLCSIVDVAEGHPVTQFPSTCCRDTASTPAEDGPVNAVESQPMKRLDKARSCSCPGAFVSMPGTPSVSISTTAAVA